MVLSQIRHFSKCSSSLLSYNIQIISKYTPRHLKFQYTPSVHYNHPNLKPNFFRYASSCPQTAEMALTGLSLNDVVKRLNSFAPQHLAESWDNVGLLIEPATPTPVASILLTNDLTEAVMQEALDLSVNMIISYHPPIFAPLKSVTSRNWKERIVAKCLENKIALYSPHTSFDAVKGGVNDWLTCAFETDWVKPIIQTYEPGHYLMEIFVPATENAETAMENFRSYLPKSMAVNGDKPLFTNILKTSNSNTVIQITCSKSVLPKYEEVYNKCFNASRGYQLKTSKYEETSIAGYGMGRLCLLRNPLSVSEIVKVVKKHLDMPHVRLALAVGKDMGSEVSTIALCAGSGSSVLKKAQADLFLTGEMFHHDVLEAVHQGTHVILTNHSDSERGFLVQFAHVLANRLLDGKVKVSVSKKDSDPLKTV